MQAKSDRKNRITAQGIYWLTGLEEEKRFITNAGAEDKFPIYQSTHNLEIL